VNLKRALLALSISSTLFLASAEADSVKTNSNETPDQFIARVNDEMRAAYPEITSAQWLASTYINSDS